MLFKTNCTLLIIVLSVLQKILEYFVHITVYAYLEYSWIQKVAGL